MLGSLQVPAVKPRRWLKSQSQKGGGQHAKITIVVLNFSSCWLEWVWVVSISCYVLIWFGIKGACHGLLNCKPLSCQMPSWGIWGIYLRICMQACKTKRDVDQNPTKGNEYIGNTRLPLKNSRRHRNAQESKSESTKPKRHSNPTKKPK